MTPSTENTRPVLSVEGLSIDFALRDSVLLIRWGAPRVMIGLGCLYVAAFLLWGLVP